MTAPLDLVDWLLAELEAQRAEIERDFTDVNSGEIVVHWNRNQATVRVETRVIRTYRPSGTTTAA